MKTIQSFASESDLASIKKILNKKNTTRKFDDNIFESMLIAIKKGDLAIFKYFARTFGTGCGYYDFLTLAEREQNKSIVNYLKKRMARHRKSPAYLAYQAEFSSQN